MKDLKFLFIIIISIVAISCSSQSYIAEAPAQMEFTRIDKENKTVIPNGRFITPRGKTYTVAPHPYGLCLSPDNNFAVTANSGISPISISIIKNVLTDNPIIKQIPDNQNPDEGVLESVFMGLAISPDNQTLYVAGGKENLIHVFNLESGEKTGEIKCYENDSEIIDGYIGDMLITRDGKYLYAVDQIGFKVLMIDLEQKALVQSIRVGRYPFSIALSPDEKNVYVANVGMYEYSLIENTNPDDLNKYMMKYPAFGYLSKESEVGITNDSITIPGLGDPHSMESFSVWSIDVSDINNLNVVSKVKTGIQIGQKVNDFPAVGGSSPNSLIATENYVFVSNGNNDCITLIDIKNDYSVENIFLTLDKRLGNLRGSIPFGLAISNDEKRLYIAEAGINAIGVFDIPSKKLLGHIPSGWFPAKIEVSNDDKKLIVTNAKGYGSGPNAGENFTLGEEGSYIGNLMKGTVSVIEIPSDGDLKKETDQVIENNFRFISTKEFSKKNDKKNPIPMYPGQKESPIKYIVFITKENRTYDEVFGRFENGEGDSTLARFHTATLIDDQEPDKILKDVEIMPNHIKLARQFSISDNFYVDADVSADGHDWVVCNYPNAWSETAVTSLYGGNSGYNTESKAPGALFSPADDILPDEYNEAGSLWDHLYRNDISFFNFGHGLNMPPNIKSPEYKYIGKRFTINSPMPSPLFDRTSKRFATFNMAIPDQFRTDMFIEEFNQRWLSEKEPMPQILTMLLPNDHGDKTRPENGYPFFESYMADNDLALGRIIEFLSHTKYWKNMAIFITEDDAQGGVDHVDAHRSIMMVISPYAKKNYIGSYHYSFGSIFKTFWHILGIPYLNHYDAGTTDLRDLFTDQPDFTPYHAVSVDQRLFDPQKALDPLDENFDWKELENSPVLDNPKDMLKRAEIELKQRQIKNGNN